MVILGKKLAKTSRIVSMKKYTMSITTESILVFKPGDGTTDKVLCSLSSLKSMEWEIGILSEKR